MTGVADVADKCVRRNEGRRWWWVGDVLTVASAGCAVVSGKHLGDGGSHGGHVVLCSSSASRATELVSHLGDLQIEGAID